MQLPSLAECQECNDEMVSKLLCYVPISQYYGIDRKQVANFLDRNTRRRYLFTLILFNDRDKAALDSIKEQSSSLEESFKKSQQSSFSNLLNEKVKK